MGKALIICSSTDGQTRRICERLRDGLQRGGDAVTLANIDEAAVPAPMGFALAVVGARIRYGKTDPRVIGYANRHAHALNSMPSAFFSVNIVARKPEKSQPGSNPYMQAFLRRVAWRPRWLEVFAGKLDYPRYGALDRAVIRFIMWLSDGPTHPAAVVEFTDWRRVDAFGELLSRRDGAR